VEQNVLHPDQSTQEEKYRLKPEGRNQREGQDNTDKRSIGHTRMNGANNAPCFFVIVSEDAFDQPLRPIYCGLLHTKYSQFKAWLPHAN